MTIEKTTTKRPGVRSLKTICDVTRFEAKIIRAYNNGDIPESHLRALTYALSHLAKFIESGSQEDRLKEIETKLEAIEKEIGE